eukprot:TRINITY_DN13533_c0_g1_i1.p1 TRINITY_DN13533_c0_g1~~TRINITY_DN13533_c0_g1_i1.p1  ORF type:complete len:274 (-),score=29.06 TRINITY_DN13533_c0_g1_i1:158-979(-)
MNLGPPKLGGSNIFRPNRQGVASEGKIKTSDYLLRETNSLIYRKNQIEEDITRARKLINGVDAPLTRPTIPTTRRRLHFMEVSSLRKHEEQEPQQEEFDIDEEREKLFRFTFSSNQNPPQESKKEDNTLRFPPINNPSSAPIKKSESNPQFGDSPGLGNSLALSHHNSLNGSGSAGRKGKGPRIANSTRLNHIFFGNEYQDSTSHLLNDVRSGQNSDDFQGRDKIVRNQTIRIASQSRPAPTIRMIRKPTYPVQMPIHPNHHIEIQNEFEEVN